MRVLITGAKGQLGHDLVTELSLKHEIVPVDMDMDVTDKQLVSDTIAGVDPDVVVHAAAYTDVDGCELDTDKAFSVNAQGAHNVALAARDHNARMVYMSTDFVFDGAKREPYTESDTPNPINVYGKSKLDGELAVMALVDGHFIARTAWLFGRHGKNFVKTIVKAAESQKELRIVDDQTGSPSYSRDVAAVISRLIETDVYGIYHVVNAGSCTWYEFALEVLKQKKLSGVDCRPIASSELNRPASRPAYSVLDTQALKQNGFIAPRHFSDALAAFMDEAGDELS